MRMCVILCVRVCGCCVLSDNSTQDYLAIQENPTGPHGNTLPLRTWHSLDSFISCKVVNRLKTTPQTPPTNRNAECTKKLRLVG
uniref:Putative secreted protein n=1 Tax=Anopheles triannulatus TaxID=58253 RepID=A0A2M4B7C1_9DIPT